MQNRNPKTNFILDTTNTNPQNTPNMNEQAKQFVEDFMTRLIARNPGETEFHQAVREEIGRAHV